ncbi:MAG: PKD-like domain-containing protein [Mangrovibacterium sp.]
MRRTEPMSRAYQFIFSTLLLISFILAENRLALALGTSAGSRFTNREGLTLTYTSQKESCPGKSDGSIDLTITNATNLKSIVWSSGQTTEDISGLAAGTYQVDVTDDNGTVTLSIPIAPADTPIANYPGELIFCQGEHTAPVMLSGTPSGLVFNISGGSTIGLSNKTGVTSIPSFTAQAGSANLTISPRTNGCTGNPIIVPVTVIEKANLAASPLQQTICSGATSSISLSSNATNPIFSWIVKSITPSGNVSGASAGTGPTLAQTLINTGTSEATVIYTVSVQSESCTGSSIDVTVRIHPRIEASISGDATICQGDADPVIQLTAVNGTAPFTFTYRINGESTQSINSNSETVQLQGSSAASGVFNYELLTVKAQEGCVYPVNKTATITIFEKPILTSTPTPGGICSNEVFTYVPTSNINGTTFGWNRAAVAGISNAAASSTNSPNEYLVNTTNNPIAVTYTYTLTSPDGCTNTQDVVVIVTKTPELTSSLTPPNICSGMAFSYTPTSTVGETDYRWSRDAVAGISNPAASGTGNPNEVLTNTTSSPQTVTYRYRLNSNGCENPTSYAVSVVVLPAPAVTASASEELICPGASVNLYSSSNVSSSLPKTLLSENFNSASAGSTSGPNNWTTSPSSPNAASWTIRNNNYTYNTGGGNVTFSSNDASRFYLANSRAAGDVNITSILTSPAINTVGYSSLELSFWHYYRSGGSSDHPIIQYSTNGSTWNDLEEFTWDIGSSTSFSKHTVSLNSYTGEPTLYIRFYYSARNDYYWAIDNVTITGEGTDMFWTSNPSGFSSTQQNPTNVSPSQTTDYIAWYTNPDTGCLGNDTVTVTVINPPSPTIIADYCTYPGKIRLTVPAGYSSYKWSTGEASSSILVDIAAIFTVTVKDAYGCTGSSSFNTANELVVNGDFEAGNVGFTTPATDGNAYSYRADGAGNTELWNEGLYGVGANPNTYHSNFWGRDHTTNSGNMMIVNGFPGSPQPIIWQEEVDVVDGVDYYFSAWAISLNSSGNYARLQYNVNGTNIGTVASLPARPQNDAAPYDWVRFYGNWTSTVTGKIKISIVDLQTAADGNDFGLDDISFGTLAPRPAEVSPTSNGDSCEGESIYLHANVQYGREPVTVLWTGPNGFTSTLENPVISNATTDASGTYTVQVWDTYGCENKPASVSLAVYPKVEVDAGSDQSVCPANPSVTLNGTITGGTSSGSWSGGTGSFSPNNQSLNAVYTPSATEINSGSITLTLTSDDPAGSCPPASSSMTITFFRSPELTFELVQPLCYESSDGNIAVTASGGTAPYNYLWDDGQTTATAIGLNAGYHSVTVTDANGCSVSETVQLPGPEPFRVHTPSLTEPSCYGATDGSASVTASGGTPPYRFIWDEAAGSQASATATNLGAGTYSVVVLSDLNGCAATSVSVTIPEPEAPDLNCPESIIVTVDPGKTYASNVGVGLPGYDNSCESIEYLMTGATTESDDGLVPSPSTYNLGITNIEYIAVNLKGEDLHCSFTVTVRPEIPVISCADPITVNADAGLCSASLAIDLPQVDKGTGISWSWKMSGATIGSGSDAILSPYTFNKGTTIITWTATNAAGTATCSQTVTITDTEAPRFINPFDVEVCVERIKEFTIDDNTRPDYYIFETGNVILDLATDNFSDNCGLNCDVTIEWRIVFANSDNLPTSGYISGQPSAYPTDILFPGDGVDFQPVVHKVYYRITDCSGNQSEEQVTTVTVSPRPQIVKNI